MDANDFVFLGLKSRVAALGKSDGRIVWTTQLPGVSGANFVTLSCDDRRVFAYASGQIHCLDLFSGRLLWSNELKGYGFGIASICLRDGLSSPTPSAFAQIAAQQAAASSAAAGTSAV